MTEELDAAGRPFATFPRDLDDLRATDRCPMCFTATGAHPVCPICGLNLRRGELGEVFRLSTSAAELLERRGRKLQSLWRESQPVVQDAPEQVTFDSRVSDEPTPARRYEAPAAAGAWGPPPANPVARAWEPLPAPAAAQPVGEPTVEPQAPFTAPSAGRLEANAWLAARPPVPEHAPPVATVADEPGTPMRRRSSIQVLLLIIGVAFVSVAAIVFLTVAFVLYDLAVKATIIAGVTISIVALASVLRWRKLTSTAEGIGGLGVVLVLLDVWAIRALDLAGLARGSETLYWGAALLLVAAIFLGWGHLAKLRTPRIASTFTGMLGVFFFGLWLFPFFTTDFSPTALSFAAVVVASLVAPILHRQAEGPDTLEIGLVFGLGQFAGVLLIPSVMVGAFAASSVPADAVVVFMSAVVAAGALVGQISLHQREAHAVLHWMRIPATILATLLWVTGFVALGAAGARIEAFSLFAVAMPFLAVPAVFWDVRHLRTPRPDKPQWAAGLVTNAVALLGPVLVTVLSLGSLLVSRATTPGSPATADPLALGIATLVVGAGVIAAYVMLVPRGPGRRHRLAIVVPITALALPIMALGPERFGSQVLLSALAVLATVVLAVLGNRAAPLRRVSAHVVLGAAIVAFVIQTPVATLTGVGVAVLAWACYVVARGARGGTRTPVMTAAVIALSLYAVVQAWALTDSPAVAMLVIAALPAFLLSYSAAWPSERLAQLDRRILAATGAVLAFVAAFKASQYTVYSATYELIVEAPSGTPVVPGAGDWIGFAFAAVTIVVLAFTARRGDAVTAATGLLAVVPLLALVVSPLLRFGDWAPLDQRLSIWLPAAVALVSALLFMTLRRAHTPEIRTVPADLIAVLAGMAALGAALSREPGYDTWPHLLVLVIVCAVPLIAAHVRRETDVPRRGIRAALPWVSAFLLAVFGPSIVSQAAPDALPLLEWFPIVIALLATALVFARSGFVEQVDGGTWLLGGMIVLGLALATATALASRELATPWVLTLIAAAGSLILLLAAVLWRAPKTLVPTRALAFATFLPLSALSLVLLASDLLELAAPTSLTVAYVLALTLGGAAALSLRVTIGAIRTVGRAVEEQGEPLSAEASAVAASRAATSSDRGSVTDPDAVRTLRSAASVLLGVGLLGVAIVLVAGVILLPPQANHVALAAATIGLAFASVLPTTVRGAKADELRSGAATGPARAASLADVTATRFRVGAYVSLTVAAITSGAAGIHVLTTDRTSGDFDVPVISGIAVIALAAAVLVGGAAVVARDRVLRLLLIGVLPFAAWTALLALPFAWDWGPVAVTSALSIAASIFAAIARRRLGFFGATAATITVALQLLTFGIAGDAVTRPGALLALTAGVSLIALAFSYAGSIHHRHDGTLAAPPLRPVAVAVRAVGSLLVLLGSAALWWPANHDVTVLLLALPGVLVLAVVGALVAVDPQTPHDNGRSIETAAYFGAAPLWFAIIAAAGSEHLSDELLTLLMVLQVTIAVALASIPTFVPVSGLIRRAIDAAAIGAGLGGLVVLLALLVKGTDLPADTYFLTFGLALCAFGALLMRRFPRLRSMPALAPGLIVTLLPLWVLEATDPTAIRLGIMTVLVVAAILAGALGKLQAPLVLGVAAAIAHVIVVVRWMAIDLTVPWWVWLASAGALLIFVAATYESRLRNAKAIAVHVRDLR